MLRPIMLLGIATAFAQAAQDPPAKPPAEEYKDRVAKIKETLAEEHYKIGEYLYGVSMHQWARDEFRKLPEGCTPAIACINAPPAPFVPESQHFAPGVGVIVIGFGTAEEHAAAIAPLRAALSPLFDAALPLPYVAVQQMLDDAAFWGIHAYSKGLYLDEISDEAAAVIAEWAGRRTSPLSEILIFPMIGAYRAVGDDDTAWGGRRDVNYAMAIEGMAPDPASFPAARQWARDAWEALLPAAGGPATYVNLMAEFDERTVRATYGAAKYERLAAVKAEYDPGNVFTVNANIKPA